MAVQPSQHTLNVQGLPCTWHLSVTTIIGFYTLTHRVRLPANESAINFIMVVNKKYNNYILSTLFRESPYMTACTNYITLKKPCMYNRYIVHQCKYKNILITRI